MYILRINSRQNLGCGYPPEIAREQLYRSTRIEGNTTSFILVDMSSGFTNHFISRMSMRLNSNLVRHCTRGGIQGTLHSKQSSCLAFKLVNRCVFSKNIIPYPGSSHGIHLPHRRLRKSVRSQLNCPTLSG